MARICIDENDVMADYATMTRDAVAEKYGVSRDTIDKIIRRLRDVGFTAPSHRPKVAADDFIECWNQSASLEEVAARLGLNDRSVRSLSAKASQYRREGHNLKYF